MSQTSYLYRRPSGIYVVRISVPARLKLQLSRGEIHVSTGCRDLRTAKLLAFEVLRSWLLRFQEMGNVDIIAVKQGIPMLAGGAFITADSAAKQFGMTVKELVRFLRDRRATCYVDLPHQRGWFVDDVRDVDFDAADDSFDIGSMEVVGQPQAISGIKGIHRQRLIIPELLSAGKADCYLFDQPGSVFSIFRTELPVSVSLESLVFATADLERLRIALAGSISDEQVRAAGAAVERLARSHESNLAPDWANRRFSDLLQDYMLAVPSERNWKDEHRDRIASQCELFTGVMADPKLIDISPLTVDDFKRRLSALPANLRNAKLKYGCADYAELAKLAADDPGPRQSDKNVALVLSRVGNVLAWAKAKWIIKNDPMAGYDLTVRRSEREQQQRELFSDEELARIFSATWFKEGRGKLTPKGTYHSYQPHYYWLPLLGLFTGGRINELSQLYIRDVRQSGDGSWYFDFNLEGPDKVDSDGTDAAKDKSLKTVNAVREVPVHPLLIKLGFIDYVLKLQAAGFQRLFPELKHDKRKGYGKAASRWFNGRYLGERLKIERNGKKTFHSLRHHFATALDHAGLQETVLCQLMGHARGKSDSGKRYRKDRGADQLVDAISKVSHTLPDIKPFDGEAGIRAIRDALARKVP